MDEFDGRSHYYLTGPLSDGEAEASSPEMDFTEEQIWEAMDGSGGGGGGSGGGVDEGQRGYLMSRSPSLSRMGSNNGRRPWASSSNRSGAGGGGDGLNDYSRGGLRSLIRPSARGSGGNVGNESESEDEEGGEYFANSGSSGGAGGGMAGAMRQQGLFSGAESGAGAGGQGVPIMRTGQQRSALIGGAHREQMPRFRQSAPMAVPQWSHSTSGCNLYPENDVEEWERDVPAQEYFDLIQAPDRKQLAFSNLEGRGRTLRGRDALSLRDSVWRKIGLDG
ncbi:hypothetical protein CBR_g11141 [Chara braunii]|uniref:Uncharacterized protein n=1 Tax=Chara braunii TaxID=69332 RepID=A0A388KQ83_CHABU|nr:hypothetical protein CBR_g11141 [Chara braunii]|eukprot:GBG72209.1 hypothetical protein CBR_g11141 [Chara braunii]